MIYKGIEGVVEGIRKLEAERTMYKNQVEAVKDFLKTARNEAGHLNSNKTSQVIAGSARCRVRVRGSRLLRSLGETMRARRLRYPTDSRETRE